MISLISFCDFPWWLAWLLPFLLGLLAGLALYAKYKSRVAELEADLLSSGRKVSSLEADLAACQSKRAEIESDLALAKGRMREMEGQLKEIQTSEVAADMGSVAAGFAAGTGIGDVEIDEGKDTSVYGKIPSDNLQIVEGIGPKMESVLKENGVDTIAILASQSSDDLNDILGKYGDKYRIIDPKTWSQQAALANEGKWEELITLQKNLDTGRDANIGQTDSKLEKMMVRLGLLKKYKQDDLKAVEGIGPKIEELLHNAGIKTWRELANTSVVEIQNVLTAAGSRFQLADPGTWPRQAEMAADGKWKALQEYQDFLQGGK